MSGGWNPVSGRDPTGAQPFGPPAGAPVASQGQAYIPHLGGPGFTYGTVPQYPGGWSQMAYGPAQAGYGCYSPYSFMPATPAAGYSTAQTFAYQPNGANNALPRQPQPTPNIDTAMPAAQMTNSSGGVGCEPGYNYFFPAEHTKAHVFKSDTPPWQLPPNAQIPFVASHIPCSTLLGELLKGFGCVNPNPRRNRCYEIITSGNGKWYKGFGFSGEDEDKLGMTIKEVGWDASRTGTQDGKPIVCLWFCKA